MQAFSIEIALDGKGVRAVRVYGKGWEQPHAYALLEKIGRLIQQLDALVKRESPPQRPVSPEEPFQ